MHCSSAQEVSYLVALMALDTRFIEVRGRGRL